MIPHVDSLFHSEKWCQNSFSRGDHLTFISEEDTIGKSHCSEVKSNTYATPIHNTIETVIYNNNNPLLQTNDSATETLYTGLIISLRPTNERRRYKVTPSLIVWAQS